MKRRPLVDRTEETLHDKKAAEKAYRRAIENFPELPGLQVALRMRADALHSEILEMKEGLLRGP